MIKSLPAIAFGFLILALVGCNEDNETHYASSEQATADRAFERGWLPEVLRRGASNISEDHDLDSNRGEASFDYSLPVMAELERTCSRIPPTRPIEARSAAWWSFGSKPPTPPELSAQGINAYQCGSFAIELDTKHNSGIMWH